MHDHSRYLPVGVFTRTHGVQGALMLRLLDISPEDIQEKEWVFVEIDGLPVPFFVTEIRPLQDDRLILSLDSVTTEERARKLAGCRLMIPGRKGRKQASATGFPDLDGYRVLDVNAGFIGIAGAFMHINENPVLQVTGKKEILIPYHPDIILDIAARKKQIRVNLPDGLLEL